MKTKSNKKIEYDVYWNVSFTQSSNIKNKTNYKSIIKARSESLCKKILVKKITDDYPGVTLTNIRIRELHKKSSINGLRLDIKDWECIRKCAFPNIINNLFKYNSNES